MSEQDNPWDLVQPQDAKSRHRLSTFSLFTERIGLCLHPAKSSMTIAGACVLTLLRNYKIVRRIPLVKTRKSLRGYNPILYSMEGIMFAFRNLLRQSTDDLRNLMR